MLNLAGRKPHGLVAARRAEAALVQREGLLNGPQDAVLIAQSRGKGPIDNRKVAQVREIKLGEAPAIEVHREVARRAVCGLDGAGDPDVLDELGAAEGRVGDEQSKLQRVVRGGLSAHLAAGGHEAKVLHVARGGEGGLGRQLHLDGHVAVADVDAPRCGEAMRQLEGLDSG